MAATATSELPTETAAIPAKKGKARKALKEKNSAAPAATGEANILAGKVSPLPASVPEFGDQKENHESISQKKKKKKLKAKEGKEPYEKEMEEMMEMLQKMKIEKEKTEELLKEKEEKLKLKEEEQLKMKMELKKLQRLKEFKPTITFPIGQSLKEKEAERKDKKKDGQQKKRPSPPYALWCKDQWNEIKKQNPAADFKEISNILGTKWKTITPEDKLPYEQRYQAEKEAYLQVMSKEKRENEAMTLLEEEQKQKTAMELLEQYLQFIQDQEAAKDKKTKKEKDPLKPKQPMSAFFLYTIERRATLLGEGKNLLEVSKIMGEEWKNMTDKQRKPYEEIAKENKEKYMKEMEVYKQKKDEEAAILKKEEQELLKIQKHEALLLLKKKEKTLNIIKKTKDETKKKQKEEKNNDPNKARRPPSSFLLFSKETRKILLLERPGINNSTINALISVKWKELSEEEKKAWNEKAAESREAYKKEYNKMTAAAAKQVKLRQEK